VINHYYLSPHLDDAVISCGGLIVKQTSKGEPVTVVTVCAGDPPSGSLSAFARELHTRWGEDGDPMATRRSEDRLACDYLGASVVHLDIPDAVYRKGSDGEALYPSEAAIINSIHSQERSLVDSLTSILAEVCPSEAMLYCPLAIGGHVDHRLTRRSAELLGRKLWYFHDLPYAARDGRIPSYFELPLGNEVVVKLTSEEIEMWAMAVAMYSSQISTFWSEGEAIHEELCTFYDVSGGIRLIAP
jgi:LmbE family N-acetylglucosaminyl deacetylase